MEDFDGQIAIVKFMEKVKQSKENGFDYRVFYAENGSPAALMYMTPFQIRQFLCYCDLIALNWQLKRMNTHGWVFCGPAGTNNNKKLVHFVHAFMITELLGFASFHLKAMSEISGRVLTDIKLIAMDGKFDQDCMFHADCICSLCIFTEINSQVQMKQLSELSNKMLVKDNHHLKTKVWPE